MGSVYASPAELDGRARCSAENRYESQIGQAAIHPLPLLFFRDASNDAWEGLGSKMVGARGCKSQCHIGEFDVAAARDFVSPQGMAQR